MTDDLDAVLVDLAEQHSPRVVVARVAALFPHSFWNTPLDRPRYGGMLDKPAKEKP